MSERSSQFSPPSCVTVTAPQSPTAHAVRASSARTLKSGFCDPIGLVWRVHVAPASFVWRMSADLPTTQPSVRLAKSTPKSGVFVPLSRGCHVLPASAVW